jgi:thymidylate kinase
MIISFSGLDGAGKSTQIDLLVKHLEEKGKKTKYLWSRGGYTPIFNLMKNVLRKVRPQSVPKSGKSEKREQVFKSPRVRKWWLRIAMFDLILLYGIYIRWLSLIGYTVICDRYIHDTKIDFDLNFPMENIETWWLWKFLNKVIASPKVSFLFIIPVKESQRRSVLKNEPFPDSAEVLTQRLETYTEFSIKSSSWHLMDGMKSIETLQHEVISIVQVN